MPIEQAELVWSRDATGRDRTGDGKSTDHLLLLCTIYQCFYGRLESTVARVANIDNYPEYARIDHSLQPGRTLERDELGCLQFHALGCWGSEIP